uniref:LIM and calponin homology domains 1a n=1 Tax=Cyprinus carpio carpio TaxID=630221 RepID=A0A9J8B8E3_CYPCA
MASPGDDSASNAHLDQAESADATPERAFQEAQQWIEAVTGRSFGDKDFRSGLENGILLCELLSSIKPGLVKKINRLPTPIAGLDNLTMFLRGCEDLGLKGSQLFDPGDLQDTSIRANLTGSDCSRKLKNVLITIYWLGKAANSCTTYNGPTLDLKEFEGLLSMMRKECVNEDFDSPKRSIRDSGYIDSWESERSDSLSPPRHGRDDSFDSLDSFGSRSQNTPSPDTVIRCNSDDSEGDAGHRKLPDVRKDDMSARRVSYKEPRVALPFNQYLPNKTNQTNYLPAPLRKRRSDREEDRRSLSNSTSPVGGERPLSQADSASPEVPIIIRKDNPFLNPEKDRGKEGNEEDEREEEGKIVIPNPLKDDLARRRTGRGPHPPKDPHQSLVQASITRSDLEKWQRLKMNTDSSESDSTSAEVSIITRKDNPFLTPEKDSESEQEKEEGTDREKGARVVMPNIKKDDLARRRGQSGPVPQRDPRQSLAQTTITQSDLEKWQRLKMNTESSGDANPEPPPIMPPEPPNRVMFDLKRPLTSTERRVLEEELAEKAKDEREDDEEDEEEERQPDIEKDDMLARRTGALQKPASGTSYNRFLPHPGSKRQCATAASLSQKGTSGDRDLQYIERSIKTKRTKIGQRNETVSQETKTLVPVAVVAEKNPDIVRSSATNATRSGGYDDDDECGYDDQLPDFEKDDMLAQRTGSYQKPSAGQAFNAFLPKPGAVKHKIPPVSGSQSYLKPREQETAPSLDSFTLSSVAPPPRDAEDTPRKCPQMMDRQEAGSVGVVGHESLIKDETVTKSPSPRPHHPSRRPLWQEDDDLPPIFRATSVSDTESMSLIDMRDEEDEMAYLRPHSQSRHEHLHNQYNKLKEEEDQWQDDLARWKNRRRSASQDLIKKEEERKMMEKLMTADGGSGHRRKSIKTYKEIVEEKERREQELHEQYCKASTPEEKAAVLQRYALRFTISDAILEKLQLPKLPSAAPPMHTSPLHQPEKKLTCTTLVETEVPEPEQTTQTHHSVYIEQKTTQKQAQAQPKTPEPSPSETTKAPEVLSAPTQVPPAPSKPVPLITPKPYSQPKFSQGLCKSVKSDGLIRVNGDSRERDDSVSCPQINVSSSPPKPDTQSQQNEELIVLEASEHQQNVQTISDKENEVIKEEKKCSLSPQEENSKEDTSTTLSVSEPEGKQPVPDTMMKRSCVVTTTIVTELTQTHPVPPTDASSTEQLDSVHSSCDVSSTAESSKTEQTSYSLSMTEGIDYSIDCEKYQREQEKLKEEWERAQREVEEEERRHHEEEMRILEETVTPLTPRTSGLSSCMMTEAPSLTQPSAPHDTIVLSLADWERKQEMLEKQAQTNQSSRLTHSPDQVITPAQQNGQRTEPQERQTATPQLQFIQDGSWSCKSKDRQEDLKKTASLDRKQSPPQSQTTRMRRTGSCENVLGTHPSKSPTPSQDTPPPSPSRSVSGKKLCSSCAHPLGKGAAMIIESLGLYFHIQCFMVKLRYFCLCVCVRNLCVLLNHYLMCSSVEYVKGYLETQVLELTSEFEMDFLIVKNAT